MNRQGKRSLLRALAACVLTWATGSSNAVMSTAGQFQVTESGSASYTIPIIVPPGVSGVQPDLALNYNSHGGNGLAGIGWDISGLSLISRCPRTAPQDGGQTGTVSYDGNDRFCLDGQRLILKSGTYGANGAEYRTERESFSKIVSYGTAGVGPQYFKVWTKSGEVLEYGNTADSRIEAQGIASVRVWALNRLSDNKNNYLTISYVEDAANGEYVPDEIKYSGNSTTGSLPGASVKFAYDNPRNDVIAVYQGGRLVKQVKRLNKIQTYAAGSANPIRTYTPTYSLSPLVQHSRMSSIQECGATTCLPTISFTWSASPSSLITGTAAVGAYAGWFESGNRTYAGDVNGDGRSDIIVGPEVSGANGSVGNWYVMLASGTRDNPEFTNVGRWITGAYDGWSDDSSRIKVTDVNGDGLSDIVIGPRSTGEWYVLRSTGSGFVDQGVSSSTLAYGGWHDDLDRIYRGDFDGDGIIDVAIGPHVNGPNGTTGIWYVLLSKAGQLVDMGQWATGAYGGWGDDADRIRVADVTGDGKSDIVIGPKYGTGDWFVLRSTGTSFEVDPAWITGAYGGWDDPKRIYVNDVNGDGMEDIVIGPEKEGPGGVTGSWYVLLSTGKSFVNAGPWITEAYGGWYQSTKNIRSTDFNGDGLGDMLLGPSTNGDWYALLSTGTGFEKSPVGTDLLAGWKEETSRTRSMDFSGDGISDLVFGPKSDGAWRYVTANTFSRGNLLTSVSNGLGQVTSISYAPLTDASVYTKDATATSPVVDLQIPMYVVSQVTVSNGVGGVLTTTHKYGGYKREREPSGRGSLGFRWVEVTQVETGLKTRTEYRQDWPYTGLVSLVKKLAPSGGNAGVLNQASYTYVCKNPSAGTNCTTTPGSLYFPYASQGIENSWDLNGAVLPTVTTTNAYDNCGSPTTMTSSTGDGYSKSTTNTYSGVDAANCHLGRLANATVTSTAP